MVVQSKFYCFEYCFEYYTEAGKKYIDVYLAVDVMFGHVFVEGVFSSEILLALRTMKPEKFCFSLLLKKKKKKTMKELYKRCI